MSREKGRVIIGAMGFIDAHTHIASWPDLDTCIRNIVESQEKYDIDFSLISNADAAEFHSVGDPDRPVKNTLECLREVVDLCRAFPGRFGAAVWLRPYYEKEVAEDLISYIEENRDIIFALKFHPYDERTRITDPSLWPYLDLARKLDLPILVHTATDPYSGIGFLEEVARANPDLRFVAAHLELCSDNEYAIEVLSRNPNIYADTAWVSMDKAVKTMEICGKNRIFFGSDNPIDGVDTLSNPMYMAYFENEADLGDEDYWALMRHNAIEFYRLPLE